MSMIIVTGGRKPHGDGPRVCDIPVGTAFMGSIAGRKGLWLRAFSGAIFVENPEHTYSRHSVVRVSDMQIVDIEVKILDRPE